MTKEELIKLLEELPDGAIIKVRDNISAITDCHKLTRIWGAKSNDKEIFLLN